MKTRRAKSSHQEWIPHSYQERADLFLCGKSSAALFLDPGLGKTSIVLSAFSHLLGEGIAKKMLVIAPLRVCQLVWEQEGSKWSQFRHLKFALLHGPKKAKALESDADIYLINPEGIKWLVQQFIGKRWPFDTMCIDELTKFKNARAARTKMLRPHMNGAARRWGLTGTPTPNGYMDLFGQFLMIDGGRSLGTYITHYRDKYFNKSFDGFSYTLQKGGGKRIEDRIKPLVLRMAGEDYLELPQILDDIRLLEMDKAVLKKYKQMKETMVMEATDENGHVTAANAAGVSSKLSQIANGAVYETPDPTQPKPKRRKVIHVHDLKLDALEDLVEELQGEPLLIAYEFQHDLARMQERFGDKLAYLGKGLSAKKTQAVEQAWNNNELVMLAAHPASIGHGLNLQEGGASHICQFGITWDLELYDQFRKRIARQGNINETVINHILAVKGSIDLLKLQALASKDTEQAALLKGLSFFVEADEDDINAAYQATTQGETTMARLRTVKQAKKDAKDNDEERDDAPKKRKIRTRSRKPEPEAEVEEEAPKRTRRVNMRRKVSKADEQAQGTNDKVSGKDYEDETGDLFSKDVTEQMNGDEQEDEETPEPKTRSRSRRRSKPNEDGDQEPAEEEEKPRSRSRSRRSKVAEPEDNEPEAGVEAKTKPRSRSRAKKPAPEAEVEDKPAPKPRAKKAAPKSKGADEKVLDAVFDFDEAARLMETGATGFEFENNAGGRYRAEVSEQGTHIIIRR